MEAQDMMRVPVMRITVGIALAALMLSSGCTSSDDSSSGSTSTTNQSPTGIWTGSDSITGLSITGYVDSAGEAVFIRSDGVQFVGPLTVSGSTLAATLTGYAQFGNTFSDNSTYGLGTLNGSVTAGSSLTGSLSFTTNGGTAQSGSWSLNYSTLSTVASSLSSVTANYNDSTTGSVITIDGNGVMTGSNASNNCVLNGSITVSDSSYDIYAVAFTWESCTGSFAALNGVQFTGLAALNNTDSPNVLTIAVAGANSTSKYGIVLSLSVT
jgi:hypothetical protein